MPVAAQIGLLILASYLVGGLPFGLTIGKVFFKRDIRKHGSKNIGASNVFRTFGPVAGTTVFILDLLKGLIPVLVARHIFGHGHSHDAAAWSVIGAGFGAVLGHNASPFLGFQGGKGVATSLGVGLGVSPIGSLFAFAVWGVVLLITRYISVASIIGITTGAVLVWYFNGRQLPFALFALVIAVFVIVKHSSNIKRLMRGEEPKVGRSRDKK